MRVRVAHTSELEADALRAARALLDTVFAGELQDSDWEHALGGVHALAYADDDGAVIGHASVVQRRLMHRGAALRAGYVEGVGVDRAWRRRGVATALMDAVEDVVRGAYDVGALGATDMAVPFYTARGWVRWRGPAWALTPDGVVRTADEEGAIYVLPVPGGADLWLDDPIMADWRDGDVW